MVDKYSHKAPYRSRDCHKDDGTPKVRYSEPRAIEVAAEFEGYHAYECSTCGSWHTGRRKTSLAEETDD